MEFQENKKKNNHGCFWIAVVVFGVLFAVTQIGRCTNSSTEDFNDNSTYHRIAAKNFFVDHLKDNLKDAKSYEEVDYTSSFDSSKGCYEVKVKYRATNSFGAKVLEEASGDVYFKDGGVSIRNVRTE